jgi:hypothetical protein
MVERETTLTPRNKDRIEEHTLQESTGAQSRSTFVSEGSSLCLRCDPRRQRLEPSLTLHLEQANRHAMQINIYHVDAFTNRLFGGNPAAVCPLNRWISVTTMQEIATENNLSETAFFVPKHNINEDPVTGSAHTTLIPYWAKKLGRKTLFARQISARTGELWCEDCGERVAISGQCVPFMQGTITL